MAASAQCYIHYTTAKQQQAHTGPFSSPPEAAPLTAAAAAACRCRTPLQVCHAAARPGGARASDVNLGAVRSLYRKGVVWLEVPVRPEDHLSIPPLEVGRLHAITENLAQAFAAPG